MIRYSPAPAGRITGAGVHPGLRFMYYPADPHRTQTMHEETALVMLRELCTAAWFTRLCNRAKPLWQHGCASGA